MFVDPELLHLGAQESRRAGDHAGQAAEHLSRGSLEPLMFGDFGAADAFHDAAGAAHAHHVRVLLDHQEVLDRVGRNAHTAAAGFANMEQDNTSHMRSVRCDSVT